MSLAQKQGPANTRVLLVNPPPGRKEPPLYPLGLATLAASLGAWDLSAIDLQLSDEPRRALQQRMQDFSPHVVGLALRNVDSAASYDVFDYFPAFRHCLAWIKEEAPQARIVVGGPGFSLFAKPIMDICKEIDIGVLYEADDSFPQLLRRLDTPGEVPGIIYRDGDGLKVTPRGAPVDVGELPAANRKLFPVSNYDAKGISIGVQTKRGCAFKCVYCTYPFLDGHAVRCRPASAVADELAELAGQGVEEVFFCDSIFNFPAAHAEEVCDELIKRQSPLRWRAFFNEAFTTRAQLQKAKAAGCVCAVFGPDGGHDTTLTSYRKGVTLERMAEAYAHCRRIGLPFRCAFMMNGPGETWGSIRRLFGLMLKLLLAARPQLSVTAMRIYPHTELRDLAVARGVIAEDDELLRARFFDPMPLRAITAPVHVVERLLFKVTHWRSG